MDRYALAAGHIADDLFAVKRVTATRARHHQIVDAAHHDRIVAQTNEPFDSADTAPISGHIADDLFAVKRVTATRARHHQIVDAAHHDRIVAQTNEPFDSADTAP